MCRRSGSVVIAVVTFSLAGAAAGQPQAPRASSGVAAPAQSLHAALDLSVADRVLLETFVVPQAPRFIERPGVMEFSGQLLVKVRDEASFVDAEQGGARGVGLDPTAARARIESARARLAPSLVEAFPDIDEHAIRIPAGWDADALSAFLMATGDYEYAEPNWLVYPALEPNDPQLNQQGHHNVMNTRDAWDHTTGDPSVIVGICDTGIDLNHPDLQAAILPGFNAVSDLTVGEGGIVEDFNGHGTATSGAAAAIGNNGVGVVGMGWNFKILPVKVSENPDGTALISDLTQGARWASDNGARVVSVSFGGVTTGTVNSTGDHIRNEDHLLCWAAGNDGAYLGGFDWENVIVVGASTNADGHAGFSNFGPSIDIVAPGVNIRTTSVGGGYSAVTGTSLSAPLVNGLLALIWSTDLSMSADEVEQLLYDQAIDLGTPGEDDDWGNGRADAGASVCYAATGEGPRPLPFSDDFEDVLDPNDWPTVSGAALSSAGTGEPSGNFSVGLGATGSISSEVMKARIGMATPLYATFWAQHDGAPIGASLAVEALDVVGIWREVVTIDSDGIGSDAYGRWIGLIPVLSSHDAMRLRVRGVGVEGAGSWYVDDLRVGLPEALTLPFFDNYEGSIDTITRYAVNSGAETSTGGTGEPSGSRSLALGSAESIETFDLPMQEFGGTTQYVRVWTQRQSVPGGASLFIEYYSLLGSWQTLAQLQPGAGSDAEFVLTEVELPGLGFWNNLRIRLRRSAGSGTWYADDLYVGPDAYVPDDGCNDADLAEPFGVLDFSDVIAFLTAFGAMEPEADLAEPFGTFDFSDVIGFLGAFGAGCP